MDERNEQEIQEDNPAATGSQSTRRPPRGRGTRGRRGPTQTEILAGNVQTLTQTVQVLMEALRESRNAQPPREEPEAAESTPTRPARTASRPRNHSPSGDRRSHRSNRESPTRPHPAEAEPSRVRSRSRRTRTAPHGVAEHQAGPRSHPDDLADAGYPEDPHVDAVNVRGSTSVFDRLGGPAIYRRLGRERSVDKPAKEENRGESRLDHLQRQLDQLVGQQYGLEPGGAVDPPFTSAIMRTPYPDRFKMPTVTSYDGTTDADEHLENYQAHMLIQNANEAALCKSFCLTLTGAARQWYRRLVPGSISCFKQLADSFAKAFLGSKARRLGASHLFGIKQGETETLISFLERFDKALIQVESLPDDTLIEAFREGIKDTRLVWTVAYDRPPTFALLRGIAWRHAEADEYVRKRGLAA